MSREREDIKRFVQEIKGARVKRLKEIVSGHVQNIEQFAEAHDVDFNGLLSHFTTILDSLEELDAEVDLLVNTYGVKQERITRGNHGNLATLVQTGQPRTVANPKEERLLSLLKDLLKD